MALIITFCLYTIIIFAIAFAASKKTFTQSGFILADRKLGAWATALGAGASDMSGWLVMALPGAFFTFGLQEIWLPLGLSIGAWFNWRFVAEKLHDSSIKYGNSQTIPSFFFHRFGSKSVGIKIAAAIVILVFFTLYISSGFVSAAMLMKSTFGWDYTTALLVGALIIVSYSTIGGFLAINWIDIFQGLLMLSSFTIVAAIITSQVGGFNGIIDYHLGHEVDYFNVFNHISLIGCISSLAWGLGYFGQPHILARFMAANHINQLTLSRRICVSWMTWSMAATSLIGIAGCVYFKGKLENPETVLLKLIEGALNPWVAGLLFSAILSAIMSTIAAQLIGACSVITEDLFNALKFKKFSEKRKVFLNRAMLVLVAIVAILLSLNPKTSLLNLVGYAWAGFGASFGPVILFSLYSQKINANSAACGMIMGAIVTIIWHIAGIHLGGIFALYEIIPGFLANIITLIVSYKLLPKPHFIKWSL
jgi:sodium/proline symporter